jgi:prolyl oligopeptidase
VPWRCCTAKGLKLDGRNPTLLTAMAATAAPRGQVLTRSAIAWLERGGVLAWSTRAAAACYGDAWHRAGFKQTKPNTWKDGMAAARWLIAQGYGSPKPRWAMGTSAGGIFVGRVVTAAPELFAARPSTTWACWTPCAPKTVGQRRHQHVRSSAPSRTRPSSRRCWR